MIHAPNNRTHFKTQEYWRFLYENGKHASRKFAMQPTPTPAQIEVAISTVYATLLIHWLVGPNWTEQCWMWRVTPTCICNPNLTTILAWEGSKSSPYTGRVENGCIFRYIYIYRRTYIPNLIYIDIELHRRQISNPDASHTTPVELPFPKLPGDASSSGSLWACCTSCDGRGGFSSSAQAADVQPLFEAGKNLREACIKPSNLERTWVLVGGRSKTANGAANLEWFAQNISPMIGLVLQWRLYWDEDDIHD